MRKLFLIVVLAAVGLSQNAQIYKIEKIDAMEGKKLYELYQTTEDEATKAKASYDKWARKMAYKVRGLEIDPKNQVSDLNFAADFESAVPGTPLNTTSIIGGGWGSGGACFCANTGSSFAQPCPCH